MAFFGDSPRRASRDAHPTDALRKKEAVLAMVLIGPGSGRDLDSGNNRTCAHSLANRGDQAIA